MVGNAVTLRVGFGFSGFLGVWSPRAGAPPREQHVAGLDVEVGDAVVVQVGEAARDVLGDVQPALGPGQVGFGFLGFSVLGI